MSANRFFWAWLVSSAAVSMLGVSVHAMLGDARLPVIASVLATVVVAIQLCATLGVHMLVQAKITGAAYRCAVAAAGMLALGAFVLNFVALRDLAVTWAGIDPLVGWIAPLIIDLGMSVSTVALLALSGHPSEQVHTAEYHADTPPSVHVEVHNAMQAAMHPAGHADAHLAAAQRIVECGVVRIAPERVAQVLEAHAAGTAPSTIQRTLNVGYSTVQRIVAHQRQEPA